MTRQELKEWRLRVGLREKDVAAMFGLTEADVIKIENGSKPIPNNVHKHAGKG